MAIGPVLREARMNKQMTTSQVAELTRMKVQIVEDLENDDFHRIAATIYGKGFIKLFAECVDLDPAPLINDYLATVQGSGGKSGVDLSQVSQSRKTIKAAPVSEAPSHQETSTGEDDGIMPHHKAAAEAEDAPPMGEAADDDLFTYASSQNARKRVSHGTTGTIDVAPLASEPTQSTPDKLANTWQNISQKVSEQLNNIKSTVRKRIDAIQWNEALIQKIIMVTGGVAIVLLLLVIVSIALKRPEPSPLADDQLIMFIDPPEPYLDR